MSTGFFKLFFGFVFLLMVVGFLFNAKLYLDCRADGIPSYKCMSYLDSSYSNTDVNVRIQNQ